MPTRGEERIGALIEELRHRVAERREHALFGVAEIRAALDAYVEAVEAKLLDDVRGINGLGSDGPTLNLLGAARRLLTAVEALPVLATAEAAAGAVGGTTAADPPAATDIQRGQATQEARAVVPDEPPASRRTFDPEPPSSPEPPQTRRRLSEPLDDEGIALREEFEAIDFDNLKDADFLSYGNEFAARARLRQEQGLGNANDLEGRIIRRLTALAATRRLPRPVYGLSRAHKGDWEAIARRVRDEREGRASAAERVSLTHRIAIPQTIEVTVAEEEAAVDDEREDEAPLVLPRLQAVAEQADVVMVGGVVKREKLDRVRARTGIGIEWIGLAVGKSNSAVAGLTKRIREGRLAALVLLNGLMDHKQSEPLVAAAREVDLPIVYADKAGKGALVKAFVELEARLGTAVA